MKRVMCVYLPAWPLQRLGREQPELRSQPVVLADVTATRGPRVAWCSGRARRAGVRPGMPLAEARAVAGNLCVQEEDRQGDRRALGQLAVRAERYTPVVGLEEGPAPQCLLLDVTGCAAYFRGEDKLLERAAREFQEQGWSVRVAISETIGAAWALARYGRTPSRTLSGETAAALAPLPVAALRLPVETLSLLADLGITHVGQLLELPRDGIPTRLGPLVLQRLDQALGHVPEVIVPHRPCPVIRAAYMLIDPTDRRAALLAILRRLIDRLCEQLQKHNWGARRIECHFRCEEAPPVRFEIGLFRPSRVPEHLQMLLRTRLDQVRLPGLVSAVHLRVAAAEPLTDGQPELPEVGEPHPPVGLPALIDSLSSRLGREAVTRPALVPDPQPEYACRLEPLVQPRVTARQAEASLTPKRRRALAAAGRTASDSRYPVRRPLRLWPTPIQVRAISVVPEGPPVQFHWTGTEYRVVRSWGPERIETGWWRGQDQDVRRDYYLVATQQGNRFWLFRRQEDGAWFVHGCFD